MLLELLSLGISGGVPVKTPMTKRMIFSFVVSLVIGFSFSIVCAPLLLLYGVIIIWLAEKKIKRTEICCVGQRIIDCQSIL